mmetsp:Transcript_75742/g.200920  ORF Transcript_75742/g.200920 Transcript_75742/m.200920 type:complete len:294 (+) Transcript_75742:28-909(+)
MRGAGGPAPPIPPQPPSRRGGGDPRRSDEVGEEEVARLARARAGRLATAAHLPGDVRAAVLSVHGPRCQRRHLFCTAAARQGGPGSTCQQLAIPRLEGVRLGADREPLPPLCVHSAGEAALLLDDAPYLLELLPRRCLLRPQDLRGVLLLVPLDLALGLLDLFLRNWVHQLVNRVLPMRQILVVRIRRCEVILALAEDLADPLPHFDLVLHLPVLPRLLREVLGPQLLVAHGAAPPRLPAPEPLDAQLADLVVARGGEQHAHVGVVVVVHGARRALAHRGRPPKGVVAPRVAN